VLVVGGFDTTSGDIYLDSMEIYNPSTNSFSPGPTMPAKLYGPAVASLPDGRVLIAGGYDGDLNEDVKTSRVFNPSNGTFSPVGDMIFARELAGAAPLPDGRILIVGGYSNASESIPNTEIFDPKTNSFSAGPDLPRSSYGVAAAAVSGGRVLVAGGYDSHGSTYLDTAFLFGGSAFSPTGSLPNRSYGPAAAPLPGGRALIAAGYDGTKNVGSALIFDPKTNSFSSVGVGSLIGKREEAAAVELQDGRALVVGGVDAGQSLDTAEILSVPSNAFKAKLKGRKVSFAVTDEGTAMASDTSVKVATIAKKKKKPKLVKSTSKKGGPGKIIVKVKLTKQGAARLAQKGKLRFRVTYTPDGGLAATKKLTLRG
jgi:hypothetical protein